VVTFATATGHRVEFLAEVTDYAQDLVKGWHVADEHLPAHGLVVVPPFCDLRRQR
jgi:hypothetical protein